MIHRHVRTAVLSIIVSAIPIAARADAPGPNAMGCASHHEGDACIADNGQAGICHNVLHTRRQGAQTVRRTEMVCELPAAPPTAHGQH